VKRPKQSHNALEIKEIATLPLVARNDKEGVRHSLLADGASFAMRVSENMFFTARRSIAEIPPLRGFARTAVADAPTLLASFAIVARATAAE
jgi:hypothetical protein